MAVSYKRILITTFYEYINMRLAEVLKASRPLPPGVEEGVLDIPISELIRKKVVVVSGDRILRDALKELRDSDADAIIVKNSKGEILGVVDPGDFLHMLEGKRRKTG